MRAATLPLLTWQEDAAAARLAEERRQLRARIERLPKMSHRRVELMARLRQKTADELQMDLERGRSL